MAKVAAPGSLPSTSHEISGGAQKVGKSFRRKTPSQLRGEQLKRSCIVDESPSPLLAPNNDLDNGLKKPALFRNPRYVDTRMDEVYAVKKSRLRILSGKDNSKENSQMEQSSSLEKMSMLSNLVTSQCTGNFVGSAGIAHDRAMEASQTIEKCSQSIFRSITELSSGGDKSSGLTSIDMDKALKGLAACETAGVSGVPSNFSSISKDASCTYSGDFCNESHVMGLKAPLDFTLKSSMRVVSSFPVSWIYRTIVSATMPQFPLQIGSENQITNLTSGQIPVSQGLGSKIFHSWVYPQSTLPSSLISVLISSAAETEFLSRRQLAWEDSFRSLYYMLRNNICRIFYVCTPQFVVMFTSGDGSGSNKRLCNAYLSQSTKGLRSILSEHDICFSMPLCRSKIEQVTAEDLVELSEIEKHNLGQIRKVRSFSDVDNSPQSLLFFSGNKDVHGLYDILLNYKSLLTSFACVDVPMLCSPVPFQNAALSSPQVKCKEMKTAIHIATVSKGCTLKDGEAVIPSSSGISYSLEIKDAYIPPWVISSVCALMGSEERSFEASFTTDPVSIGLNVALGSLDDELDSRATSDDSSQQSGNTLGIPEAIVCSSLRSGLLKGLKYSNRSYTAHLSPACA